VGLVDRVDDQVRPRLDRGAEAEVEDVDPGRGRVEDRLGDLEDGAVAVTVEHPIRQDLRIRRDERDQAADEGAVADRRIDDVVAVVVDTGGDITRVGVVVDVVPARQQVPGQRWVIGVDPGVENGDLRVNGQPLPLLSRAPLGTRFMPWFRWARPSVCSSRPRTPWFHGCSAGPVAASATPWIVTGGNGDERHGDVGG
jgi:hypothetical protein